MIHTEKAHLPVVALSHAGMSGKNNEDRYAVSAFTLEDKHKTPALLAVLSDGIGGHRAGEVAAEMAVNLISHSIGESRADQPARILQRAVQAASNEIFDAAQQDLNRRGMGATCACAWIIANRLYTATVGDSRIYLLRGSKIFRLSTDHTWVQEALDNGILQPEQAAGHPNAHVIRRYLGSPTPPEVDFRLRLKGDESDSEAYHNQGMPLQKGDQLLLCSDGLTDLVDDLEILAVLQQATLEHAAQRLIEMANQRGGHDNITVIAIGVPRDLPPVQADRPSHTVRNLAIGCLALLALAALGGALLLGWLWLRGEVFPPLQTPPAPGAGAPTQLFVQETPLPAGEQPLFPQGSPVFPTATDSPSFLGESGPTLTPWPTHTSPPAFTPEPEGSSS